jgi:hypothetical protein
MVSRRKTTTSWRTRKRTTVNAEASTVRLILGSTTENQLIRGVL